jgi:predicted permease
MRDLRYAVRQLVRSPGFTLVAVLTLTLGMGANTAFFSVFYGVVLQQPAYPDAAHLLTIHNLSGDIAGNGGRLARAEVVDYRAHQRAFASIAAADLGRMTVTSNGAADAFAERVKVSRVTPDLFSTLGIAPARGRGIRAGDEKGAPLAVLSHELWLSQFHGADDVLQRTIRLNGVEYAIVGVMPPAFAYPEPEMGAWLPLDLSPRDPSDRTDHYLGTVARLAPGVSASAARADLQRVARELQHDLPAAYPADTRWSIGAESLRQSLFGQMLMPLGLLMLAAASVLLIACVNVAIMSLLRALGRRREIAIRLAIGATRRHVLGQLATEAAVLCTLGAGGGLFIADSSLSLIKAFAPAGIPRLEQVAINLPVALFTGAVLILVTLVVGLAPSAVANRIKGFGETVPSGRASEGRPATRLRDTLTVMEIALAAALIVCAGLTVRSLQALVHVDLGFATEHRFSFKTNLTEAAYPDLARADRFYEQLTAKLEALPDTISIGAISYLPLSGEGQSMDATLPDNSAASPTQVGWGIVRGRYFETMNIALVAGRLFDPSIDRPTAPAVTVVDDVLARRLWAGEANAVGQRLRFGGGPRVDIRTVIGVVHHVSHVSPGRESLPMAYAPQSQVYQRGMYTVVRTTGAPDSIAAAARAVLASVDPTVPLYFAQTVDARYDDALAIPRLTAGLVSAFSTLALLLAGVGIFGVTAYAVSQRTREFGIRFALGAQRADVARLVLGRVALLAGLGLALGAGLGLGLGSLMSSILYGVQPDDTPAMAAALTAIAVTTLLASLVPLRHATRVSPTSILRSD